MTDCINNTREFICSATSISFSLNNWEPCDGYKSIVETDEYKSKYYKAVMEEGVPYKKLSHGKRIELYGRVFYTEEDTRFDGNYYLTDEQSGYLTSLELLIKVMTEKPEEAIKTMDDVGAVIDLPDYEEKTN